MTIFGKFISGSSPKPKRNSGTSTVTVLDVVELAVTVSSEHASVPLAEALSLSVPPSSPEAVHVHVKS